MGGQIELLAGAQDEVDPFDLGNFRRLELGVAAHHDYEGFRVALHRTPHRIPAFGIRMVCHAARVDDHHVGRVVQVHAGIPRIGQLAGEGGGFAEVQLATKGVKCCFEAGCHGRKVTFHQHMQLPPRMLCYLAKPQVSLRTKPRT